MKKKINFNLLHGTLEGIYQKADPDDAPLVIITNGSNGFYSYGMFPYIQQKFFENGISSFSYNFSHGGIVGDADHFTELDLYEKNCMRLETEDLAGIIRSLKDSEFHFTKEKKLILMAHSMGGIPTVFAARQLLKEGFKIDAIILVSSVRSLDRFPKDVIKEWEETGVRSVKNNRTKQDLPMGREFLQEVKDANSTWSLKAALKDVDTNFLIVHGENDEAVSVEDAYFINGWIRSSGHPAELIIIPGAGHTYGTKHPFAGSTSELEQLIDACISWIKHHPAKKPGHP